jgi:protein-disulfide isomerase
MKLIAGLLAAVLPCLAAAPDFDKGKTLGYPSAPVLIEVFSDFECPGCKGFHEITLPLLMRNDVASGKVCIVSREFPIPAHKYSREAANWATAAARIGAYDAVASALFRTQNSWGESGKVWEAVSSALTAEQRKKVQALMKDPSVATQVQADLTYGISSGVNQTPTLVVSHTFKRYPMSGGALAYNLLQSMIDDLLK